MTEPRNSSIDSGPESGENILLVSGEFDEALPFTELRLANGRVVRIATTLLKAQDAGPAVGSLENSFSSEGKPGLGEVLRADGTSVIPIVEERLDVSRRTVPTGRVRLEKTVQEFQQALDEPLAVRTFDVERVILNQPVEVAPPIRHEGATTIYPLVEEQLILTKQLILKEELHVTQRDTERRDTQVVTLRREHLVVERETLGPKGEAL